MPKPVAMLTEADADVSALLGTYTELVNNFGVGSEQAKAFLAQHAENAELRSLARGVEFLRQKFDLLRAAAAGEAPPVHR
jgi:hypothetical protein